MGIYLSKGVIYADFRHQPAHFLPGGNIVRLFQNISLFFFVQGGVFGHGGAVLRQLQSKANGDFPVIHGDAASYR